jgi:DNA-damage-inducible protein D
MPLRDVKRKKGLSDKENILDRAGHLELSANDFQMNLAAEVIVKKEIRGEGEAIAVNQSIGEDVRKTMKDRRATLPESLPIEPPIAEVKKRLANEVKPALESPKADGASI